MKFDLNFITTILIPVVSVIVTLAIYFFQKTKKQIGYKIISSQSFPTYDKPISELKYPNKEVIIQYINTGNTALEVNDFHSPIRTDFPGATIISAKKHFPGHNDEINFEIVVENSSASFTPDLLNPGESILLYFFLNEFHNQIHVSSRIKNGAPVFNKTFRDNIRDKIMFLFIAYLAALISNISKTGKILFTESAYAVIGLSGVYIYWFIKDYRNINRSQYLN